MAEIVRAAAALLAAEGSCAELTSKVTLETPDPDPELLEPLLEELLLEAPLEDDELLLELPPDELELPPGISEMPPPPLPHPTSTKESRAAAQAWAMV